MRSHYLALVTKLADGGDLDSYVRKSMSEGALDASEAKGIGLQVSLAIKELHANEIVHRDLKPANILRFGDTWKVTDFGIAKNLSRLVSNRTFRGGGTRGYKAPEQHEGANAHPSADIYSLGKTFAFLVTGQTDVDMVPFDGWRSLIRKCLAFVPTDRPTIDEVIEELQSLPV